MVEEIRAYLSEPEKEPLNLNCKSVQKRLVTQWGYSISGKRDPLREEEIEVVMQILQVLMSLWVVPKWNTPLNLWLFYMT